MNPSLVLINDFVLSEKETERALERAVEALGQQTEGTFADMDRCRSSPWNREFELDEAKAEATPRLNRECESSSPEERKLFLKDRRLSKPHQ